MTPEEADALAAATAAYVHIPFCARVCPYCDFAVVAGRDDLTERYVDATVSEIARAQPWRPLEAVYVGGGTPSHVDPGLLARFLDALSDRHGLAAGAEISIEVNPEDFSRDRASRLRHIGFNRISFGAQSFDGDVLVSLGRRHSPSEALACVRTARDVGFDNVSVDLIFGTPGETNSSWEATVADALSTDVDHVSCYALTVEPGTPLGRSVAGGAPAPDPDVQANRWELADAAFAGAGLGRYEVSNWSRTGMECRYNMTVWAQGEYEAYGLGAHGFRNGWRYRNMRHLDTYLRTVESGRSPRAGEEALSGPDREVDRLFVGLRRVVGVAHGPGTQALAEDPDGARLFSAGVLEDEGERMVVRRPLLTDLVHRTVLTMGRGWEQRTVTDNVSA